jgi:hypothetical protein
MNHLRFLSICFFPPTCFEKLLKPKTYIGGKPLQRTMLGKLDIHMQKSETRSLSLTRQKINSKWIKDFNVKPGTLKVLQ